MSTNKITMAEAWKKLAPPEKTAYLGWRLASIIVAGAIVLASICTALFVYQNIYSTINNTYSIFVLNSELGMDVVNMNGYQKMDAIIADKKASTAIPTDPRNIFSYPPTASTTTNTKK